MSTGLTGLSRLPHRCARYPNRLPILSGSLVTSAFPETLKVFASTLWT